MSVPTRHTKQKRALRDAFAEADRPLSPDEALQMSKRHVPGMSIATVYRNIGALVEDGWLSTVDLPGAAARYELAGKQHHHHFRCTDCEKVYDLQGCDLPARPSLPKGFRVTSHDLFLYGTCSECR